MIETVGSNKFIDCTKTDNFKRRVRTRVFLFLMDPEVFTTLCSAFIRGEITSLEYRLGATMKHPKDKYDKKIAKAEAAKNFKKMRADIKNITSTSFGTTRITATTKKETIYVIKKNDKILVQITKEIQ